jgi:hypothetical protein
VQDCTARADYVTLGIRHSHVNYLQLIAQERASVAGNVRTVKMQIAGVRSNVPEPTAPCSLRKLLI